MVTSIFPNWQNNAFIYSPLYSSLVLRASGVNTIAQQDMVDSAGTLVNIIPNGLSYFSRCWAIIGILTLNGDIAKAGLITRGITNPPTPNPTPSVLNPTMCCPAGFTGLKSFNNCSEYYHCVNGVVTGPALQCAQGTLFQNSIQNCNWINSFTCDETPCNGTPSTPSPVTPQPTTISPTSSPQTSAPHSPTTLQPASISPTPSVLNPTMCCPAGFTGLKSFNNCSEYYHCVNGVVTGSALQCAQGTLFQNSIQNCNWVNSFTCDETPCNAAPPPPKQPTSSPQTSAPHSPSTLSPSPPTSSGTCGGGFVGNGVCRDGNCCSEWGWCGITDEHCNGPTPPSPTPPSPSPPSSGGLYDNRMIAYMGNWQACPTPQQVAAYTHIVIAFAVSYTWSPGKNICSETCEIATPPVCNNALNQHLIQDWQNAGKKVLLSFGGAGMGGSWDGNNDCWEYCFGREEQVIDRVSEIVIDMGLDGVDIDYEYYYEDGQNNSPFSKGAEAQHFLTEITVGLKDRLGPESIITHA